MRRFFVPSTRIHSSQAIIDGKEFHHLRHVLRLRIGDSVVVRDERGQEHHGQIVSFSPRLAEVALDSTTSPSEQCFSLTLAVGLLKGQKMDLVVEKTTELGVSCLLPFTSAFTVAELPSSRQHERLSRWQRIAQSAAKQSGSVVPQILPPQPFERLLTYHPSDTQSLLLYEHEHNQSLKTFAHQHSHLSSLFIIVGSEGGFTAEEIALARREKVAIVGLGSQILRAETAGIVAVALCRFLWGDSFLPPLPER
ncbi:MAG: 16S rRNA (uracil(1498)-N(3))-methyltransferase [Candidatus Binatia bacterium]